MQERRKSWLCAGGRPPLRERRAPRQPTSVLRDNHLAALQRSPTRPALGKPLCLSRHSNLGNLASRAESTGSYRAPVRPAIRQSGRSCIHPRPTGEKAAERPQACSSAHLAGLIICSLANAGWTDPSAAGNHRKTRPEEQRARRTLLGTTVSRVAPLLSRNSNNDDECRSLVCNHSWLLVAQISRFQPAQPWRSSPPA